jgi:hypothetical protein
MGGCGDLVAFLLVWALSLYPPLATLEATLNKSYIRVVKWEELYVLLLIYMYIVSYSIRANMGCDIDNAY